MYEIVFQAKKEEVDVFLLRRLDYFELLAKGFSKRDMEKGGVQQMLDALGYEKPLKYNALGKPFLAEVYQKEISISHRKEFIAMAFSKDSIGVDVEGQNMNLSQQKEYFMCAEEIQTNWSDWELLLIWSAKEALYKKLGGVDLKPQSDFVVSRSGSDYIISHGSNVTKIEYVLFQKDWILTWV